MERKPVSVPESGLFLKFLYNTVLGRVVLKGLSSRRLSVYCGKLLDAPVSRLLIPGFIKKNNICMDEYVKKDFTSFNDCFTRQILPENRIINRNKEVLISPCDGLLSVYNISKDTVFPIKQSRYTVLDLLQDTELSEQFYDGVCMVFRLCVNHYHRYCYIDSGFKGDNHFISGKLHTVRPIALRRFPVFTENCREYTLLKTENFGSVVQLEVGAMLVGKIKNYHGAGAVKRGDEKGLFCYGGSTIVVLLQKDAVKLPEYIFEATKAGKEIEVRMGEQIGISEKAAFSRQGI